jgi:cysteine desulfurase
VIYLDAAATGPTRREVLEAMWPFLAGDFGNPSSSHALGVRASEALESARASIAQALNCRSSEIIFTSGGTEADNLAIKGIALANPRGRHIVTSPIEHEAVLESCDYLCRLHQFELTQVVVDRFGMVDLDSFAAALRDNTTLCSVMLANNEVGTIQPVAELARLAHARGIPFHTDAVQAAGALDLDTKALGIDALSLSGHKLGAPKGIGALFLRGRLQAEPVLHGGGQERGRRSGTENVAGAVGLARALELATADRKRRAEHLSTLRDELIRGVLTSIPGAILTGHPTRRLPNHASFVFPGTSGEAILLQLEQRGILCSSGSACAAGRDEPSHVLLALGFAPEVSQTAVRLTLSDAVTSAQIPDIIAAVQQACAAVRHGDRPPDRPSHPR